MKTRLTMCTSCKMLSILNKTSILNVTAVGVCSWEIGFSFRSNWDQINWFSKPPAYNQLTEQTENMTEILSYPWCLRWWYTFCTCVRKSKEHLVHVCTGMDNTETRRLLLWRVVRRVQAVSSREPCSSHAQTQRAAGYVVSVDEPDTNAASLCTWALQSSCV